MSPAHIQPLARSMADRGIQCAFGVSGSGISFQLIAAMESLGIRYYPVAHEAAAALMAGAACRDGRTRAAAITIKGPGFANLVPGILSNLYEGRPALTISEAFGTHAPAHRRHKRLDHLSVGMSVLKAYSRADGSPSVIAELIGAAETESPGPVHLDVHAEGEHGSDVWTTTQPDARPSEDCNLAEVLAAIERASRPALVLGSFAARRFPGTDWATAGVPVATTAAAKGAIDEESDFAAGVVTGEIKDLSPESAVLAHADLVVSVGLRNGEVVLAQPFRCPHYMLDVVSSDQQSGFDARSTVRLADPEQQVLEILTALQLRSWGRVEIAQSRANLEMALFGDRWQPPVVYRTLAQHCPGATPLVLDTGLFCTLGETVWRARSSAGFCGSSCGRFMGTSVPTALGIAARERRPVLCVAGDGGMRPFLPEMKLAVEEHFPVLFVLMSDGQYGSIAAPAIAAHGPGYSRPYAIQHPSWWKAVEAMGCPAYPVDGLSRLETYSQEWARTGGPMFLELRFEPTGYARLTEKLR